MFHVVMPAYGRTDRVVFSDDVPRRLLLDVMSFEKRPNARNARPWSPAWRPRAAWSPPRIATAAAGVVE